MNTNPHALCGPAVADVNELMLSLFTGVILLTVFLATCINVARNWNKPLADVHDTGLFRVGPLTDAVAFWKRI